MARATRRSAYLAGRLRRAAAVRYASRCGTPRTGCAAAAAIATGTPEIEGYAEDYAYLIAGLLELFQADAGADVARVGDRAAAAAGRAVLGRSERRLVQHDRPAIRACCCG